MNYFCILYIFALLKAVLCLECDNLPTLPQQFMVKRSWTRFYTIFYSVIDDKKYNFYKNVFSMVGDVTLYQDDKVLSSTSTVIFSWANTIHFFDCNDKKIFTVVESSPFYNLNGIDVYYNILDSKLNKIGSIEHTKYLTTEIILFFDVNNNIIAHVRKDTFSWLTTWDIEIKNSSSEISDLRLIGMFVSHEQFDDDIQNTNKNSGDDVQYALQHLDRVIGIDMKNITYYSTNEIKQSGHEISNPDVGNILVCVGVIVFILLILFCVRNRSDIMDIYRRSNRYNYEYVVINHKEQNLDSYGSTV